MEEAIEVRNVAHELRYRYDINLELVDLDEIFFKWKTGDKPEKKPAATLSGIRSGWVRDMFKAHDIEARYCFEVYQKEWLQMSLAQQQWLVYDLLLSILGKGKLMPKDVVEFSSIVEFLGPQWRDRFDLPSLLDPIPLSLPLQERPSNSEDELE